jgi:hypothetical protein
VRRLLDKVHDTAVLVHLFFRRRPVAIGASVIYMAGAVTVTLLRQRLLPWSRAWQTTLLATLKSLPHARLIDVGAILQRAEAIFH